MSKTLKLRPYLGANTTLRATTTGFVTSVRPDGTTRLALHGFSRDFTLEDFSKKKISRQNSGLIKACTLTEVFLNLTEVFLNLTEVFLNLTEVFLNLTEVFLNLTEGFLTLTGVYPCFFLSCTANARVKFAKTGHGPHSSTLVVICAVRLLFVLFYVLFVCKCVLPQGDNPIAVNKYIKNNEYFT